MALLLPSYVTKNGVYSNEAYLKVKGVSCDYVNKEVSLDVLIYYDKNARINNSLPIEVRPFFLHHNDEIFDQFFSIESLSMNGVNQISQTYLYLKTLDEFMDSIDDI